LINALRLINSYIYLHNYRDTDFFDSFFIVSNILLDTYFVRSFRLFLTAMGFQPCNSIISAANYQLSSELET